LDVDWEAEDALWWEEGIFISDEEYKKRVHSTFRPSFLIDLDRTFDEVTPLPSVVTSKELPEDNTGGRVGYDITTPQNPKTIFMEEETKRKKGLKSFKGIPHPTMTQRSLDKPDYVVKTKRKNKYLKTRQA